MVLELEGIPAKDVFEESMQLFSGTVQWRRVRASWSFGTDKELSVAKLKIRRGTKVLELEIPRGHYTSERWFAMVEREPIMKLEDGIYYVDLRRADMKAIKKKAEKLAVAPGIVFDLRGYPNSNHDVIRHLIDETVHSAKSGVPRIIYPDGERLVGYDTSGRWTLEPKLPRFKRKIVFITDGRAIS